MLVLRQMASAVAAGTLTEVSATNVYSQQLTDVNARYIMQLAGPGKFSSDFTVVGSGGGTFSIPLPQAYDPATLLYVMLASDQTVKVTTSSTDLGTSNVMVRAGLASDQPGVLNYCGQMLSILITNPQATAATVEWFLFQMPDITQASGWRDGSLALGTLGTENTAMAPSPIPSATTISYADSVFYSYGSGTVDNTAWVQISAATAALINYLIIQDTSGVPIYLGAGAAGHEQIILQVPRGGISGQIGLTIPAGTRLSLKAVTSSAASTGEFDLTGFT